MKKVLLAMLALSFTALGLRADVSPTATTKAVAAAPAGATKPTPTMSVPKPVPTPKPLYVDYQPPDWAKGWEHITLSEAEKMHKRSGVLFLDARAFVEYQQGHIPGALPLPTGEADKYYAMYLGEIKHAKKLVTYCHGIGCRLSEKSAKFLVDKGYKNVSVFFGGWPQWNDAKLPIETGDSKAPKSAAAPEPTVVVTPLVMTKSATGVVAATAAPTASSMPKTSPPAKADKKPGAEPTAAPAASAAVAVSPAAK